ncbi:MAG TPA: protease pro-enzyme activation domain-containing protein, partial [Pyrinomonadaceae bacterium]|nr:protease pro-enzyme activation domain-containing protein [Pyrinomonadaceae bacterium]
MSPTKGRQRLTGSEREMLPNAKAVGKVDPEERIEVTIMVRPKSPPQVASAHADEAMSMGAELPEDRQYLNRGEQFAEQRGADPADFDKIEEFAHQHNLTVTGTSISQRIIKLSGTIADLQNAFKANLKRYRVGKITFRGRTGSLSVPGELADTIVGIYGFDTRPAAMPHFRMLGPPSMLTGKAVTPKSVRAAGKAGGKKSGGKAAKKKGVSSKAAAPAATTQLQPFIPPAVAKLYNFPAGLDGAGQCIAIIELNTPDQNTGQMGTGFTTSDLQAYFKKLNLPMPQVTAVGVGGGANLPNINRNTDVEVMLDIEVAGAVAPRAQIAVYFAPNTSKGFIEAVSAAVHDTVRKPSVVSISWGGPEDPPFSTKQFRDGLAQVLQDAATLGVTVCCASGDNGSFDIEKFQTNQAGNPLRD